MSLRHISHNKDIQQLLRAGLGVSTNNGHLLVSHVPFRDASGQISYGTLVSPLELAGNDTVPPKRHDVFWTGGQPHDESGPLPGIVANAQPQDLGGGMTAQMQFSVHPGSQAAPQDYRDLFHKMTTYIARISGPAQELQPDVTAYCSPPVEDNDPDSPFLYLDTASARAGTDTLNDRIRGQAIAIIGLGGTGSYVLDLVAKAPVTTIRIIDGDIALTHNAFRSPGAMSLSQLENQPKKVDHLNGVYSRLRTGIEAHPTMLDETNLHLLDSIDFAFLCLDSPAAKRPIVRRLESTGVPFIDVGMGLRVASAGLTGHIRTTLSDPGDRFTFHDVAGFGDPTDHDHVYASNIQIAELNAINAALAVIAWKRYNSFYYPGQTSRSSMYHLTSDQLAHD